MVAKLQRLMELPIETLKAAVRVASAILLALLFARELWPVALANSAMLTALKHGASVDWALDWTAAGMSRSRTAGASSPSTTGKFVAPEAPGSEARQYRTAFYRVAAFHDEQAMRANLIELSGHDPLRPHEALALARLSEREGDENSAENVLLLEPSAIDYLIAAAQTLHNDHRRRAARTVAHLAYAASHGSEAATDILGRIVVESGGESKEAVKIFGAGIRSHPDSFVLRRGFAHALLEDGQLAAAAEQVQILESRSHRDAMVSALRGEVLLRSGKAGEAEGQFVRSLEIDSRNVWAVSGLCRAYEALGEIRQAEACNRRALAIDSTFRPAMDALARLRDRTGA
jgi:predicted Zn-dependent protease